MAADCHHPQSYDFTAASGRSGRWLLFQTEIFKDKNESLVYYGQHKYLFMDHVCIITQEQPAGGGKSGVEREEERMEVPLIEFPINISFWDMGPCNHGEGIQTL